LCIVADGNGFSGKGHSGGVHGATTNQSTLKAEGRTDNFFDSFEDFDTFSRDFRTYSVTGQDCYSM
jgi:hypothetical protein